MNKIFVAVLQNKYGRCHLLFGANNKKELIKHIEKKYGDDILSFEKDCFILDGDEWIDIVDVESVEQLQEKA